MQTLKQQIQSLMQETPIDVDKIKGLLRDSPETKPKQSLADQRAIASLKLTIKSLRDQLNCSQAPQEPAVNAEALLDQLHALQQKRSNEILENGLDFTFGNSERTCKALIAKPDQMYFTPGTPLSIGLEIRSATGNLSIVSGFKSVAGRIEATVWTPRNTCQKFDRTPTASGGFNLKSASGSIPCTQASDTITTFREKLPAGTLIKLSDSFYTVVGSYSDGNLVRHKIQPYAEHKTAPVQINRPVRDTEPLRPGHSLYWSRTLA